MARSQDRDSTAWLLAGLYTLATSAGNFFLPVFFSETLRFSGHQIGLLYAVYAATGVVAAFPAGWGNDRVTSRTLILASLAAHAAGFALMATVTSYPIYIGVFLFWGLAANLFRISLDVEVLKTDSGMTTGSRIGMFQGSRFVGLMLGTLGSGYLLTAIDFRLGLVAMAAASLSLMPLAARLLPTPLVRAKMIEYGRDMLKPGVLFFCAWIVLFASHWGAEFTCYGLFLRKDLGLDLPSMGLYMCGEFAAIAGLTLLVGRRLDQALGVRVVATVGLLLSGVGNVGMVFEPAELSFAFRFVHGLGDGAVGLVLYVGLARLFKLERMGGNAGMVSMLLMVGMILGALVYGPLGESFGYGVPMVVSGVVVLLLAAPVFLVTERKSQAPRN